MSRTDLIVDHLAQYISSQKVTYNGHLWTAKWWVYGCTSGGASQIFNSLLVPYLDGTHD